MNRVPCWQVDAFTNRPFAGNPAAVCWLEEPADPAWMQSVAAVLNLAETAFVRRLPEGYVLRWFTPTVEVDLCAHATLATAHALWWSGKAAGEQTLRFHTHSGVLTADQSGSFIELNFPSLPPVEVAPPPELMSALGVKQADYVGKSKYDYIVVLESEAAVRAVKPDFPGLREVPTRGVIVTAPAADPAFTCATRFFAPAVGVDEDPVCGSAHCCLGPYWSQRSGKTELMAFQASQRTGILRLRVGPERVVIGGEAVTVWEGNLI